MTIVSTTGSKKWSSPCSQKESMKCSTWVRSQKWQNYLGSFPRQSFSITVIQVRVPTTDAEEAEVEWFCEDLQHLLELTHTYTKDVLFIIEDWNAKVGSQEISGITGKFDLGVQNKAGQRLTELSKEHTGHSKHPLPTTQEKILHTDITRWSILKSDWVYSSQLKMEELYIVSKNKTRSWLWLRW